MNPFHKVLSSEAFEAIKAKLITADGNLAKIKDRDCDRHNSQYKLQWRVGVACLLAHELHVRGGDVEQIKKIVRQAIDRMLKEVNDQRVIMGERMCICNSVSQITSVCLTMGLEDLAHEAISHSCPSSPQGFRLTMSKPYSLEKLHILRAMAAGQLPQAEVGDCPQR